MTSKKQSEQDQTVEQIYKKKTLHEHILSAPDTYIGSAECSSEEMWIYDKNTEKIILKDISFPPGLYKINDELYVNARDHQIRDPTCKTIKISIDQKNGIITVFNDGNGIQVEIHKDVQVYVPEMIFGHLLTSSNYEVKGKTVGGKNGYGAKLANIYSEEFIIETVDKKQKKMYKQVFSNNMYTVGEPLITDITAKTQPYTKITFKPDLKRFGIDKLSDDFVALLEKRVYDLAACTNKNVGVYLNDKLIKINSFEDYVKLYFDALPSDIVYQEFNERWRVAVLFDKNSGFRQVSFVNGICTYQGGTHVKYILDQITGELINHIKNKHKLHNVKAAYIKDNLTLFVDAVIEDPAFKSQTKEELTTKMSDFGSKCELTPDFIQKILKLGIVDEIIRLAEFKHMGELNKTDFKKSLNIKSIPKLDDATWAGTSKSHQCRLILTEGDSAKTFAVDGLEIIGKERYGVFPLRGKFLNVREATVDQLKKNQEFINLKHIIGLKQGQKYDDTKKLRYGGIIILTDQDKDGSHIKGLLINMFATFWPSLLKLDGFIQCIVTPIMKVWKKSDTKRQNPICFYSLNTYKDWLDKESNNKTKYDSKYYKGLGTSTSKEAKEVFKEFDERLLKFIWEHSAESNNLIVDNSANANKSDNDLIDTESEDGSSVVEQDLSDDTNSKSHEAIVLAFDKSKSNDRKKWIFHHDKNDVLDLNNKNVTFSDFINKELIHFSIESNHRSIPSLVDGLKPSQRKILFSSFKKGIENTEIKVAQLGGYVAEKTEYHHGEQSLYDTIIKMAQNFIGSNNINYLTPNGNFGTRRLGGKDASSARYIFTQLNKITSKIFRKEDEAIYEYVDEDGTLVEPVNYAPIFCTALLNEQEGIGTGFSTYVPPFNPIDIIKNTKLLINGDDPDLMIPWWRGFKGEVKMLSDGKVQLTGLYEIINDCSVRITELPIGTWIEDYKNFLNSLVIDPKSNNKTQIFEKIPIDNCGNNKVDFTVFFANNELQRLIKTNNLEKKLKLVSTVSLNNMYLYNSKNMITKYSAAEDIMIEHYKYRYKMYIQRKEYILKKFENELKILESKVRFIEYIITKKLLIQNRHENEVIEDLKKHKFEELSHNHENESPSYKYLTDMKLFSLTSNKMEELIKERDEMKKKYLNYKNMTIEELWLSELDEFLEQYEKWFAETVEEDEDDSNNNNKKKKVATKKKVVVKGKSNA